MSGAIGHGQSENPEVKVWRVENDKLIHTLSLSAHSLGIVSVDVSPNGKCTHINYLNIITSINSI